MKIVFVRDFNDERFISAFQSALNEFSVDVDDFENLIEGFNSDRDIFAYLICENEYVLGMIQFQKIELSNQHLSEELGMIREFWITPKCRNQGYGKELLKTAENYFVQNRVKKVVLFSRPEAEGFYQKQGYSKNTNMTAFNGMSVYEKSIKQ